MFRYLVGPAGNLVGNDLILFGEDTYDEMTNNVKVPDATISDKDAKEITTARLNAEDWKKVFFTLV